MKFLTIIFLLIGSITYAEDLQYKDIDLKEIEKSLPKGWYISAIYSVDAPTGWARISGSKGLEIKILRVPYSFKLSKTKAGTLAVNQPEYIICVCPNDFSGKSADGTIFKNGKEITPKNPKGVGRLILFGIKPINKFYFFYLPQSFQDWKKPEEIFNKILKKKPHNQ